MVTDKEFENAAARTKDLEARVPRAVSARYDRHIRRVVIQLKSNLGISSHRVTRRDWRTPRLRNGTTLQFPHRATGFTSQSRCRPLPAIPSGGHLRVRALDGQPHGHPWGQVPQRIENNGRPIEMARRADGQNRREQSAIKNA